LKITLAWPASFTEYLVDAGITGEPDETIDVPDELGLRLLQDGRGRLPDVEKLSGADVEQAAAVEGVDLSDAHTVADKKAAVKAARKEG
jgi:hypothetical protein